MLLLAGCGGGPPPKTYDLTAPADGVVAPHGRNLLVIAEPIALQAYDSQRIIVVSRGGGISALPAVQWADRLPKLFQTRLIQTFENGSRIRAVGRPGDRLVPAAQLNTDIRVFAIDEATSEAVVEISAKIVNDRSGNIVAGEVFRARYAVGALDGPSASAALDLASQGVMRDIVRWVSQRM